MALYEELLEAKFRAFRGAYRPLTEGECVDQSGRRCHICYASRLNYEDELAIKRQALREYWAELREAPPLDEIVSSPMGRHYRTNSKRRCISSDRGTVLTLTEQTAEGRLQPFAVRTCAIEPESHARIYELIAQKLEKPYARILRRTLNFVILKGNYAEQTLILNVEEVNNNVMKATNTLSKSLTHEVPSVVGVFLYEGDSGGSYYLGTRDITKPSRIYKVYGKSEVFSRIGENNFLYHPLSFSQVNLSILAQMVERAGLLLRLDDSTFLYDFYCGYGVFSLGVANKIKGGLGVEVSEHSIQSAISNAKRQRVSHIRFLRASLDADTIERMMQNATPNDAVLLDPPRQGAGEGVIAAIAQSGVGRVLHIFCNVERIGEDIAHWRKSGYRAEFAVPFDAFPGTSSLEVMVLLHRES